jgi:hypothetical protein
MARRTAAFLLCTSLIAPAGVVGQSPYRGWSVVIGGNLSMLGLDLDHRAPWRSAWGFDVRLNVTGHVHVGLSGASPFRWRQPRYCADARSGCVDDYGAPYFLLTTGSLGVHGDIGRLTPFIDVGGGQVRLEGDTHAIWLAAPGTAIHLSRTLDLVATYRVMRVAWPYQGIAVPREWSIGVSVNTPPLRS